MKYTQTIIKHFTKAMNIEIARLEKVHKRVGDDWPPWFDPNDMSIYDGMIEWLENLDTEEPENEYIKSKPYGFMMEVVGRYVNENIASLSDSELKEIASFWEEYVTKSSA